MLEVRSLKKGYDSTPAVDEVSFTLVQGQVLAVLGPSGSGKSTLLYLIAGLEQPDAGDILWQGESIAGVPPDRRSFGLMFQDYVLFPHKDVADNVGFGLKMQGKSRAEIAAGVRQALELVGLKGFEQRDVNTLSGGEQQRVALARAIAPRPRLLLLDEPLGALDRALRARLLDDLDALLGPRGLNQTTVYVTHDQEEAFALADWIIILRAGHVAQAGTPAEVYARPVSRFVAEFLGLTNIVRVEAQRPGPSGEALVQTAIGVLPAAPAEPAAASTSILLRPDSARVVSDGFCHVEGRIIEKSFRGSRNLVRLQAGESMLTFEFPPSQPLPKEGESLRLRLDPAGVQWLP